MQVRYDLQCMCLQGRVEIKKTAWRASGDELGFYARPEGLEAPEGWPAVVTDIPGQCAVLRSLDNFSGSGDLRIIYYTFV